MAGAVAAVRGAAALASLRGGLLQGGGALRCSRGAAALARPRGWRLSVRAEKDPGSPGSGHKIAFDKQSASGGLEARLYDYLVAHTREPEVLAALREETASMQGARMQITPEEGQFLGVLVELMGARKAIEVGVFTGYSSVAIATALPEDGTLVACEMDERPLQVARRYWDLAGVAHKVDERVGPAKDTLAALLEGGAEGTFDLAFIDADKRGYDGYYEQCLRLVRRGGCILIDNVLWYGKVADPEDTTKATLALKALNDKLVGDERVSLSIVPVGDGVAICRVR